LNKERGQLTVCKHDNEDNQCQGPFEFEAEDHQGNCNIDEGRSDGEQQVLSEGQSQQDQ
jgi:hypothetical protein